MATVPSPPEFFLELAPYKEFPIGDEGFADVLRVEFYPGTLDTFCVECGRESVFKSLAPSFHTPKDGTRDSVAISIDEFREKGVKAYVPYPYRSLSDRIGPFLFEELEADVRAPRVFEVAFSCTRDTTHKLYFFFRVNQDKIAKVGQSPSLATLEQGETKKYRKVLGEERAREFNCAIGLHAHGVGIGAFVYLRRIFEDLIEQARVKASKATDWDDKSFQKIRMDERIQILRDELPQFLVETRAIYSILSAGLHELSEEECLQVFEPVKTGIELILDEELRRRETEEKTSRTRKQLGAISTRIAEQR